MCRDFFNNKHFHTKVDKNDYFHVIRQVLTEGRRQRFVLKKKILNKYERKIIIFFRILENFTLDPEIHNLG